MLSQKQVEEIKNLQQQCETFENIELKLNWDMLRNRENDDDDFLHYEEGQLVGFLGVYSFGESYELCGMVHPRARKRGIFTLLFNKAITSLKQRNATKLLVNAPASSLSAQSFLSSIPAKYDFSEYQMKWNEQSLETGNQEVTLRSAKSEDYSYIVDLDVVCFNVPEKDAKAFVEIGEKEEQIRYIIERNGKQVGKIQVQRENGESYLFGFAVHPDFQGNGIGRAALAQTVKIEAEHTRKIYLEVAVKNAKALKLYESTGFVTYQTQDYYQYPL
jgi:ribosomal protein S18 acetylase RimI-like enzyme